MEGIRGGAFLRSISVQGFRGIGPRCALQIRPGPSGNLGSGAIRGPGLWNIDLSIGKNFPLRERVRLQFRADMFDVLNHPNFGNPGRVLDTTTFGVVSNTRAPTRATGGCADLDEWFLPGTAPTKDCDWHQGGTVVWPAEYVEWAAQNGRIADVPPRHEVERGSRGEASQFQIVSPRAGDRYQIPPGMDARYATIALRASTMPGDGAIRWFIDGRPIIESRWALQPGTHVVRAVTASGATSAAAKVACCRPACSSITRCTQRCRSGSPRSPAPFASVVRSTTVCRSAPSGLRRSAAHQLCFVSSRPMRM